jgi:predicted DNA-binding transcriptional regulator YafY
MRKADRLFRIVQELRGRRLTTARYLAEWLQVSERTIYRDIADLSASGVPVEGEAGVGYRLKAGFEVPPLMFTFSEVEALTAGARILQSWGGNKIAEAARSALTKIAAAVPEDKRIAIERTRVYAPGIPAQVALRASLDAVNAAIGERRVLDLTYEDVARKPSRRAVRPLALFFWGGTWTLAAWCELREDFRMFRIDRVKALGLTERRFKEETGKRFEDMMRQESGCA